MMASALLDFKDSSGNTLLAKAIVVGDCRTAMEFIQAGNEDFLNVANKLGMTALMLSVQYKRFDIALELLKNGADVHRADCKNRTALFLAVACGCKADVVQKMLSSCLKEGTSSAKIFINRKDRRGTTPLHFLCMKEVEQFDVDNVRLLCAHHADVDSLDKKGQTPLAIAVQFEKFDIARILLDNGSEMHNVSVTDAIGNLNASVPKAMHVISLMEAYSVRTPKALVAFAMLCHRRLSNKSKWMHLPENLLTMILMLIIQEDVTVRVHAVQ